MWLFSVILKVKTVFEHKHETHDIHEIRKFIESYEKY